MRFSLLKLTQDILSAMDSDEVNSIGDTVEATQVATVIVNTYNDIVSQLGLPTEETLFELQPNDVSNPVVMHKPESISEIHWIKYDKRELDDDYPKFSDVRYVCLEEFLQRMFLLDPECDEVSMSTYSTETPEGVDSLTLLYYNERSPKYWTSWNDSTILFDAYDQEVDAFLQKNKTQCYGSLNSKFQFTDTFDFPNLPEKHFPLLFNEAKSTCFVEVKQQENPKAEQRARKNWFTANRLKHKVPDNVPYFYQLPNYGRRR